MATLRHLLLQMAHADLRAVATRLGVRRRHQHSKEQWAEAVAAAWHDPQQRDVLLQNLTPHARMALLHLVEAGELPAAPFWGTYGSVRRAVAARRDDQRPWQTPATAAEELYYNGLLHLLGSRKPSQATRVQMAADLRLLLAEEGAKIVPSAQARESAALLHDLGQYLIYCNSAPQPRLHSGRWLRQGDLQALNRRLRRPQRAEGLRAHRRNAWLALLAFLAACAGLQDSGRLAAAGWAWLRLSPADQLETLWRAWRSATPVLRAQFPLASAGFTDVGLSELLRCLPRDGSAFTSRQQTSRFAGAASLSAYLNVTFPTLEDLQAVIRRLLAGELIALGIVEKVTGAPQQFAVTADGERLLDDQAPLVAALPSLPASLSESGSQALYITFVDRLATATQATVALFAAYVEPSPVALEQPASAHVYCLNGESLRRALAAGYGLPALNAALYEAGLRCTPAQQRLLASWAADGEAIRLHTATLLETDTPARLADLLRQPVIKQHIGRVLRPTIATVNESPAQLVDELLTAGYGVSGAAAARGRHGHAQPAAEEAVLWLAGMVYAAVGRFAPLPLPPPYTALSTLHARLSAAERAAVAGQLAEITANLLRWLDHFSFTPPPEATDPARWLPLVQEAITGGKLLTLHYFSAGRNLLVRFIVEPYWLEEHQGALYLRGDPQTGASEAILFRLDRIQSLALIEPGTDGTDFNTPVTD